MVCFYSIFGSIHITLFANCYLELYLFADIYVISLIQLE